HAQAQRVREYRRHRRCDHRAAGLLTRHPMPASVKSIAGYERETLTAGWELCSTAPDAYRIPRDLSQATLQWLPAHAPSTAAACLRAANLWNLDAPPRRFDAEDWWY